MSSLCSFLPLHFGYVASIFTCILRTQILYVGETQSFLSLLFLNLTVLFSDIREYLQGENKCSTLPEWRLAQLCYVLWPLIRLSMCYEWAHTQEHTHTHTTYVHFCITGHTNQLRQIQRALTQIQAGLVTLSCSSLLLIMLEVCSGENIYVYMCTIWIFLVYGLRLPVFPIAAPRSQSPTMLDLYIQDILHSSSSYSLVHTHVTHSGKLRNKTWLKYRIDYGDLVQGIARSTLWSALSAHKPIILYIYHSAFTCFFLLTPYRSLQIPIFSIADSILCYSERIFTYIPKCDPYSE